METQRCDKGSKTSTGIRSRQVVLLTDQVQRLPCVVNRALMFPGKMVTGGQQNCTVKARRRCHSSIAISLQSTFTL